MTTQEISFQLEQLVDKITLPQVIEHLATICHEKATHLRENWQDENAAKLWGKNAYHLQKVAGKLYS